LDLPEVEAPYIVIENQGHKTGARAARSIEPPTVFVVSLAKGKEMTIGRSNHCDVRVNDVSLSRVHATIHLQDGEFILEDNRSKFGTLLELSEHRIEPGTSATIQCGSTCLSFSMPSGNLSLMSRCSALGTTAHMSFFSRSTLGAAVSLHSRRDATTTEPSPRAGAEQQWRPRACFCLPSRAASR
jgi:predicted component of type VI protein secretion system